MKRVFFLISHLHSGGAQQLRLLVDCLPAECIETQVCVLGADDGKHGFPSSTLFLNSTRLFDLRPLLRLRRHMEPFSPDVIHVCDRRALRAGLLALGLVRRSVRGRVRLVASDVIPASTKGRAPTWTNRLAGRRLDGLIARGTWEATVYRAWGVPDSKVHVIAPAIDVDQGDSSLDRQGADRFLSRGFSPSTNRREGKAGGDIPSSVPPYSINLANAAADALDAVLPRSARFLACLGEICAEDHLRDAIWVLDILRCVHADLQLVVIGNGPERAPLVQFARDLGLAPVVHFLDHPAAVQPLLARAAAVVVPGTASWAIQGALAGMAAGRPVAAFAHPSLDGVIVNAETGFAVNSRRPALLARKLHALLEDPQLGRRLGEAGQQRAREQFAPAEMVRRHARLYENAARRIDAA
jgi:glycosyltransferase involved in cell wall biosynthesis